jgi:hypothetical protein
MGSVVSVIPPPRFTLGNEPQYPLDRRLGGAQASNVMNKISVLRMNTLTLTGKFLAGSSYIGTTQKPCIAE